MTVEEFCKTVNEELIRKRLGWQPCEITVNAGSSQKNGLRNWPAQPQELDLPKFFDQYAAWLKIENLRSE